MHETLVGMTGGSHVRGDERIRAEELLAGGKEEGHHVGERGWTCVLEAVAGLSCGRAI